ncbi:MAG: lysophospholipid acyltransferase family protein [Candidatus Dormibacteria bacterium]
MQADQMGASMGLEAGPPRFEAPNRMRAPALPRGARPDGTESGLLVLTRAVLRVVVRITARGGVDLQGLENLPARGPLLICSNHLSNFDPLVYAATIPRVVHALTKEELFRNPLAGAFFSRCNCILVRRGEPDRLAIRGALAVLRGGGALIVFPEGHRSVDGRMRAFELGAGYLAVRSEAQVLPCAIWGTERVLPKGELLPRRGPIAVRLGDTFQTVGKDPAAATAAIRERVAALLPAGYRPSADCD